jgi:uncharacterized UBP type Zn finger protein
LVALGDDCEPNLRETLELMMVQYGGISRIITWDYNPEKHVRSPTGLVGLRNMGSTCYMNSLMQQFYMIPKFRYALLCAEDKEADKKESLLWQVQTMFGFLTQSVKQSFDTAEFCYSYKVTHSNHLYKYTFSGNQLIIAILFVNDL